MPGSVTISAVSAAADAKLSRWNIRTGGNGRYEAVKMPTKIEVILKDVLFKNAPRFTGFDIREWWVKAAMLAGFSRDSAWRHPSRPGAEFTDEQVYNNMCRLKYWVETGHYPEDDLL